MKKNFLAFILPILCLSQNYELGKVTLDELKEKRHPLDTSAVAAVLFEKGKSHIEYSNSGELKLFTEVETKIKIYKKEGYEFGNKEVSFYIGGVEDENVQFTKAVTYNLVNGKIEKTKLNGDGEFKEINSKYWSTKKITMPNVKEGSIIEYKYVIESPYFSKLNPWYFQYVVPVNYSEFIVQIPENLIFKSYYRGFLTPKLTNEKKEKRVTHVGKTRTVATLSSAASTKYDYNEIVYNELITKSVLEHVPALKQEPFSNNLKNYISSVEFELSSIQYKDSPTELVSTSWEDVVKRVYESNEFGGQLGKEGYFEDDLKSILANKPDGDKINVIFKFVQERMKWNGYTGIYTEAGVKKAYAEKVGNVAEINLILISMLRKAGIDANPVVLTTREKPFNLFPSNTAFNYVICGIEIDNDVLLLDATDSNASIDILPTRTLNYIGRIVRNNGSSSEINLAPKKHAKETYLINATIDTEGLMSGTINEKYFERAAYVFRNNNANLTDESYIEKYEKNNNGVEISDYVIQNKRDVFQPVIIDYKVRHTGASELIGGKIYFKPLLHFGMDENPFKHDKREYPIDFISPFADSYTVNYYIPDGYVVESMPSQLNVKTIDNIGSFSFLIGNTDNHIQIVCNFRVNAPFIDAEYYPDLKEFFNQVTLKMNEKIILKKL